MAENPFIGEIMLWPYNQAPRGWGFCDGQLVLISSMPLLFDIIGTAYGGDGSTTFALPDLRGRVAVGLGTGPGLSTRNRGESSGVEQVILTTAQIPSHTHTVTQSIKCNSGEGNSNSPVNNYPAQVEEGNIYSTSDNANMNVNAVASSIASAGNDQPHTNMMPFTCLHFIIAYDGVTPTFP